jgi:hypothetical protein
MILVNIDKKQSPIKSEVNFKGMKVHKIYKILFFLILSFLFSKYCYANTIGNDDVPRIEHDGPPYTGVIIDFNNAATSTGYLIKINYFAITTNIFNFVLVFSANLVTWTSPDITPDTGFNTYNIPNEEVPVTEGYNLGIYIHYVDSPVTFEYGGAEAKYTGDLTLPAINTTLDFVGSSNRTYSFIGFIISKAGYQGVISEQPYWSVINAPNVSSGGAYQQFIDYPINNWATIDKLIFSAWYGSPDWDDLSWIAIVAASPSTDCSAPDSWLACNEYHIATSSSNYWHDYTMDCHHTAADCAGCSLCGISLGSYAGLVPVAIAATSSNPITDFIPNLDNPTEKTPPMYYFLTGSFVQATTTPCQSWTWPFNYICELMSYLFIPTGTGNQAVIDGYTALKLAFPFNTFYNITDTIHNAISTTTPQTNNTLGVPMYNGHSFYILPVLASSSVDKAIGHDNNINYRKGIGYIMWIVTAGIALFIIF